MWKADRDVGVERAGSFKGTMSQILHFIRLHLFRGFKHWDTCNGLWLMFCRFFDLLVAYFLQHWAKLDWILYNNYPHWIYEDMCFEGLCFWMESPYLTLPNIKTSRKRFDPTNAPRGQPKILFKRVWNLCYCADVICHWFAFVSRIVFVTHQDVL